MKQTIFSPCRKYRYTLWRTWDESKPYCQFIGLNPSTADETEDDPTIRRCIAFARSWGYGALCMTNLFAWRDTKPANMKRSQDPIGEDNDRWLPEIAKGAAVVIAAWGANGNHLLRSLRVKWLMRDAGVKIMCLRLTKGGHPEHPLYLPASLRPIQFV